MIFLDTRFRGYDVGVWNVSINNFSPNWGFILKIIGIYVSNVKELAIQGRLHYIGEPMAA